MKLLLALIALVMFAFTSTAEARKHRGYHNHKTYHVKKHAVKKHAVKKQRQVRRTHRPAATTIQIDIAAQPAYPIEDRQVRQTIRKVERTDRSTVTTTTTTTFSGSSLIETARRYLGTNPTGRRSLWCGAFMEHVVRQVGGAIPKAPALARSWATLPRSSHMSVGSIAVMARKGGGHVGIVTGISARGNPIIISGNSRGRRVAEGEYPAGRIYAYVRP